MAGSEQPSQKVSHGPHLDDEALGRIAGALADSYRELYQETAIDPRTSLTGDMLAFAFEGGLSVADESLLKSGRPDRLSQFRLHFFEVVDEKLAGVVADLTGRPVTYSFYGFDAGARTSHAIFILDTRVPGEASRRESDDR